MRIIILPLLWPAGEVEKVFPSTSFRPNVTGKFIGFDRKLKIYRDWDATVHARNKFVSCGRCSMVAENPLIFWPTDQHQTGFFFFHLSNQKSSSTSANPPSKSRFYGVQIIAFCTMRTVRTTFSDAKLFYFHILFNNILQLNSATQTILK